jgi:CheY-like chemotaxis protein
MSSRTQKASGRAPKKNILLVDDDPSVREMLSRVLADEGYFVRAVSNGQEALEVATAKPVDLVLLDLNMPGLGGWDALKKLTTNDPLLAVIIITAKPNQLFTSLGAGVGALLEKPLDFPILLQTIKSLLDEPAERRLARLAGQKTDFHYQPSAQK